MQTRRIGECHLSFRKAEDAQQIVTRGLWKWRNDGQTLPKHLVEEGGLADVGSTNDGDGAETGGGGSP